MSSDSRSGSKGLEGTESRDQRARGESWKSNRAPGLAADGTAGMLGRHEPPIIWILELASLPYYPACLLETFRSARAMHTTLLCAWDISSVNTSP
jgi:hypothetical protein